MDHNQPHGGMLFGNSEMMLPVGIKVASRYSGDPCVLGGMVSEAYKHISQDSGDLCSSIAWASTELNDCEQISLPSFFLFVLVYCPKS